jgi:hypothetical protein
VRGPGVGGRAKGAKPWGKVEDDDRLVKTFVKVDPDQKMAVSLLFEEEGIVISIRSNAVFVSADSLTSQQRGVLNDTVQRMNASPSSFLNAYDKKVPGRSVANKTRATEKERARAQGSSSSSSSSSSLGTLDKTPAEMAGDGPINRPIMPGGVVLETLDKTPAEIEAGIVKALRMWGSDPGEERGGDKGRGPVHGEEGSRRTRRASNNGEGGARDSRKASWELAIERNHAAERRAQATQSRLDFWDTEGQWNYDKKAEESRLEVERAVAQAVKMAQTFVLSGPDIPRLRERLDLEKKERSALMAMYRDTARENGWPVGRKARHDEMKSEAHKVLSRKYEEDGRMLSPSALREKWTEEKETSPYYSKEWTHKELVYLQTVEDASGVFRTIIGLTETLGAVLDPTVWGFIEEGVRSSFEHNLLGSRSQSLMTAFASMYLAGREALPSFVKETILSDIRARRNTSALKRVTLLTPDQMKKHRTFMEIARMSRVLGKDFTLEEANRTIRNARPKVIRDEEEYEADVRDAKDSLYNQEWDNYFRAHGEGGGEEQE